MVILSLLRTGNKPDCVKPCNDNIYIERALESSSSGILLYTKSCDLCCLFAPHPVSRTKVLNYNFIKTFGLYLSVTLVIVKF